MTQMDNNEAVAEIDAILKDVKSLRANSLTDSAFSQSVSVCSAAIDRLAPRNSQYVKDKESNNSKYSPQQLLDFPGLKRTIIDGLEGVLQALRSDYSSGRIREQRTSDIPGMLQIERILDRFHLVALQLTRRHADRETLEIMDEYDVQDLLHSLLHLFFDDIRPEDPVPRTAGGTSRMDFLLKAQRVVIEVKKTRQNLADREIGEELLIDIARYRSHPDCDTLICFVYDPERRILNPTGLKHDLELQSDEELSVLVKICSH
jgi:hypothetical protein